MWVGLTSIGWLQVVEKKRLRFPKEASIFRFKTVAPKPCLSVQAAGLPKDL